MIRAIEPTDASAVYDIITASLGYATSCDIVRERILQLACDPHYISLACEDDAGVVQGFLHAVRYDTLHSVGGWDVISLAVRPDAQGMGIGKELLTALEERVRLAGGTYVRLNSRVERTDAHGFYEHVGYTCDKLQKRFIKHL